MKEFKRHIALLLLAGFAFPQVINSVHYFVVPHYSKPDAGIRAQLTAPAFEYHSCHYQLSGKDLILLFYVPNEKAHGIVLEQKQGIYYSDRHSSESAFHFLLRGPPNTFT